jgi:hypothetical protein
MQARITDRPVGQAVAAIRALDLDPIKFKLMDPEEGQGWSREYVERMELAYKRFLTLLVTHPEETLAPGKDVDKFWHGHILDTLKYAEDCDKIFGCFLHHFPYFGMRGAEDAANLARAAETTQRLYRQEFGSKPEGAAAYCGAIKAESPAYCGAVKAENPAYCGAIKADEPAYCGAVRAEEAAYCGAIKADEAAYCGAIKAESPAYCGAVKADEPAYCGAVRAGEAAYCGAIKADEAAYCGAIKAESPAYCGAVKADEPAYCGAVRAGEAAYCGAIKADEAAYCGAIKAESPAYCGAIREERLVRSEPRPSDTLKLSLRPGV